MWFSFGAVIATRALFLLTLPLNDLGGDAGNYFAMVREGTSSLVHAGGYPFLIGLPFRVGFVERLFGAMPGSLSYAILVTQHAIDLAVLFVLYKVASRIFGRLTGAITLLLAGTNFQALGATSATYPEWLQADLLVLYLAAVYYGYSQDKFGAKAAIYGLAALAFTWCILAKFNAAVLVFVFIAVLLMEPLTILRKSIVFAAFSLVLVLVTAIYIGLHHRPSTGTNALTMDGAWVLLTRIESIYGNDLKPTNGPNTRRWLALSRVLPKSYLKAGPGMFSHVRAVGRSVRGPYRERFGYLLTADDDAVNEVLAKSDLPEGFSVGLSPIPVAYYIGLSESEHLGVRVAVEAVRAEPGKYAAAVARDVVHAFQRWPRYAPFPDSIAMLYQFGLTVQQHLPFGYVRVNQRPDYSNVPFSYSVPVLWWPGMRLIDVTDAAAPSMEIFLLLATLATAWAAVRIVWFRAPDGRAVTILLLSAVVVVVVVFSAAILSFRWKEATMLTGIVSVLAASGVGIIATEIEKLQYRWRTRYQ